MRKTTAGKMLSRILVLALLMMVCMMSTVYAAEVGSMQALLQRINANDGSIVLTSDIAVTQTINIGRNKNVAIDLNGYQLTRSGNLGTMFSISNGGKLTISDSKAIAAAETVYTTVPNRDNDASNGTGIALPSSLQNGTLTYYETRSTVNSDGISTTETRYQNTVKVNSMGRVGGGNSTAALIQVSGSGSTLNIRGGAFTNSRGRIIEASNGAALNLTGGYFYNSATNSNGGAIYANGSNARVTVNVGGVQGKEAVFVGNTAVNGGALATNSNVTLNIHDGAVFTGNKATGTGSNGGGAIYTTNGTDIVMDGGLITNNWGTSGTKTATNYSPMGGGMLIRGTLLMTNGQITHNEAAGGGGIGSMSTAVMVIRGGIIAGNVARVNEGGGVTVNVSCSATIIGTAERATYITNNATETDHHWGGGGIFTADGGTLRMLAVVITDNEAGGFGGGLAGCSTGRIDAHALNIEEHSIALYGNSASGTQLSGSESTKSEDRVYALNDPVFMREGDYFQDYFCALNTTVCSGMLGGGRAMWTGTVDGRPITPTDVGLNEKITSQYITGLSGDPSQADINKAINKGLVFVTGNSSGTHGGGILVNGYMIIGVQDEMNIGDRMTIKGDKTVSGGTVHDEFTFIVTDDKGNQITTGTSEGDSEITFIGRLPFDTAGTYTFWIYEANENIPQDVKMDQTRYRLVVTVTTTNQNTSVPSMTDPSQKETIYIHFNKITSIAIYKHENAEDTTGVRVANYTNISSENRNAYALPYTFEFVNRVSKDTGIVVSKTVHDLSEQSSTMHFSFTVTLDDRTINGQKGDMYFRNGVATFMLQAGQSRRAVELPANIHYTVTETLMDGYHIENYNRTGTTVQDQVQSIVFENTAVGSLKIKKTVAGSGATDVDRNRIFAFTITLIDSNQINGPYGSVIFENGVAHVELKHGQEITIPNLPAGIEYTVREENTEGFTANATVQSGTISIGQTSSADFINTRKTGELHIKKYVIDSEYNGEKFDFSIELINASHINGQYGDVTFVNGKATVSLGNGETVKATGLPTGLGYTVDEVFSDEYSGHYAVGVVGNSSGSIGDSPAIVEYTNEAFAGLEIRKDVSGTTADLAKEFTFELTLTNDTETLANSYGGLTFVNGKATFTLQDGEYLVLTGLPDGTKYTVKELNVDGDLYRVRINDVTSTDYTFSGVLNSGDSAAADFHNFRQAGELEISKTVVSPVDRDDERVFEFIVTVSEPINVRLGDMMFVDGVAHVYLKHGQTAKATTLPAGLTYTITEVRDADFNSAVTSGSASGTIAANKTSSVAFTNTRRLGNVEITKVVEGDVTPTDVFGFKVTLDRELNGTFGDVTFTAGVGTFEIKGGETVHIENLPEHTVFTIIETTFDALKYKPLVGTIQGDIVYNDTMKVEFRNEMLGTLVVHKTVEGVGADKQKEFTFTVTLSDSTINGTYGEMTFQNGVATLTLKHDETKAATHLPDGVTYTVTEAADSAYKTTVPSNASGSVVAHQTQHVDFNNTFITGSLEVSKKLVGDAVNPADVFTFTVTLGDTGISGTYGDMTFSNGVATFTLRGGEKKTATNLPAGVTYTVAESASKYETTVPANAQGTIAGDTTAKVEFVNTLYIQYGGLTVQKVVSDADIAGGDMFQFTVTLDNRGINGVYGGMTFTNGVATFALKAGESISATGLPENTAYTVVETAHAAYSQVSATNATGTISANSVVTAVFTNAHKRGGLTVTKTIEGDGADMTKKFTFTVLLSDATINGTYGEMTFVNGVATFQLGHQERATATRLPAGIRYNVYETGDDYTVTSTGETGVIVANSNATAAFTNTKMIGRGGLTVTKTIEGDGADMTEKFTFTVLLSDITINGTYGDMTFVDGAATFQLGHQESATATRLPAGIHYSVAENGKGYTVASTGETGTIVPETIAKAEFTNTKMLVRGNLMVSKTITGDRADMTKKFTFRVTLDDASINGVYGGMTFVNGVATCQLGHTESVTAERLPAGIGYTVEELDYEDYEVTAYDATGVVNGNQTIFVTFVNNRDAFDFPETGDQTPVMLYVGMMVLSAAVLTVLRKKTHKA